MPAAQLQQQMIVLCFQLPSSPQLDRRQQSSKLSKRTIAAATQKLDVKALAEGRSPSKSDIKKGIIFVIFDTVFVIYLSCLNLILCYLQLLYLVCCIMEHTCRGMIMWLLTSNLYLIFRC